MAAAPVTPERLEQRRRRTLAAILVALAIGIIGWPIGTAIGDIGGDNADTVAGACYMAAIVGLIAAPWILRAWQRWMARNLLAAIVQDRPDVRYAHGEDGPGVAAAGFQPRAFQSSGLVEPFDTSTIEHVLFGRDHGVPFTLAEANLNVEKGFRVFGGVLACFELPWSRPGITIVTRDRGLIGNLVASAGSGVERIALEDPIFERVFEAYGTDQVLGRVILTTTMLERLKELDDLAQAQGFVCAFTQGQLLVALRGLRWRCPFWRIAQPTAGWLDGYRAWLLGLIELPARIATTLRLDPVAASAAPAAPAATPPVDHAAWAAAKGAAVTVDLVRLVGELAMPALYIASGSLFGGVALVFARMWWETGYSWGLGWWPLGMVAAGIVYGIWRHRRRPQGNPAFLPRLEGAAPGGRGQRPTAGRRSTGCQGRPPAIGSSAASHNVTRAAGPTPEERMGKKLAIVLLVLVLLVAGGAYILKLRADDTLAKMVTAQLAPLQGLGFDYRLQEADALHHRGRPLEPRLPLAHAHRRRPRPLQRVERHHHRPHPRHGPPDRRGRAAECRARHRHRPWHGRPRAAAPGPISAGWSCWRPRHRP